MSPGTSHPHCQARREACCLSTLSSHTSWGIAISKHAFRNWLHTCATNMNANSIRIHPEGLKCDRSFYGTILHHYSIMIAGKCALSDVSNTTLARTAGSQNNKNCSCISLPMKEINKNMCRSNYSRFFIVAKMPKHSQAGLVISSALITRSLITQNLDSWEESYYTTSNKESTYPLCMLASSRFGKIEANKSIHLESWFYFLPYKGPNVAMIAGVHLQSTT